MRPRLTLPACADYGGRYSRRGTPAWQGDTHSKVPLRPTNKADSVDESSSTNAIDGIAATEESPAT